jgi:2-polyprenyl-3-methyl-5-hydroxy-6-metoxy-1,4-benzoquinol methylase
MTVASRDYKDLRWSADDNRWESVKDIIGDRRVTLGPQASQQYLDAPDHLAMVLARYRAAAALIGGAQSVLEAGSGEGIGARILAKGRQRYCGIDNDAEAVKIARQTVGNDVVSFAELDLTNVGFLSGTIYGAVVSLDVIEHIPAELEDVFMMTIATALRISGVCVIGTPNAAFDHLASPQSKAGHINTYTHERLHALMSRSFHVVQSFGMQDTSLHLGHPEARHYLLMAGIGPRR